jgi:anti-sigma factor RsiW
MSDETTRRPDLSAALRDALPVYEAPATLSAWATEQARRYDMENCDASRDASGGAPERKRTRTFTVARWQLAAALVCAAALGWAGATLRTNRVSASASASDQTANALVDTHIRSLLPGHLIDVQSSDRHTVKPWFAGRIDISPPVMDLASKGFPLIGGRLDYVQGHRAAVIVYGRRLHMINLFVWRTVPGERAAASAARDGYGVLHWTSGDLSYWAVSDAAPAELDAFRAAYLEGASPPASR